MIDVVLPAAVAARVRRELRRAGDREIGGVLAGEDLGEGRFLVADLSVQRSGGGVAHFLRDPGAHRRFMRRFLARNGNDYARFNYLGEWHSHPRFPALPSSTDLQQMQALMDERGQQARFLVLLVVKLGRDGEIEATGHAFRRGAQIVQVRVMGEEGEEINLPRTPRERLSSAWMAWRRERAKWL
jgi:[CysO sulfur-carrier protein]-S-L-cysteine hydrolase